MTNDLTLTLRASHQGSNLDRAPAFESIPVAGEAAARIRAALEPGGEVSLGALGRLVQDAAQTASAEIAMELAGIASTIAREIMRGRRCEVG